MFGRNFCTRQQKLFCKLIRILTMKRFCLALDLVDDEKLIAAYEEWHKPENSWPEIQKSIIDAGVLNMGIYRTGNRLFMIMEVDNTFSFERKAAMDLGNYKVQEWEQLMWKFQQSLPFAKEGEKWVVMSKIFSFKKQVNEQ
jgi:L-rhamnose mutarotase